MSNARQLLTIYLNESVEEDIKDFIINRNPELALNIHPFQKRTGEDAKNAKQWADENEQMAHYLQTNR